MKLIITGPRSVGKSTISKIIARKLGMERIDLDSISNELLKNEGGLDKAIKTNKIESLVKKSPSIVKKILQKDNIILDLPGGSISSRRFEEYAKKMMQIITKRAVVIGLLPYKDNKKSIDLLFKREKKRAHFKTMEKKELQIKVKEDYLKIISPIKNVSNIIIFTERKEPIEIANKIIKQLTGRQQ